MMALSFATSQALHFVTFCFMEPTLIDLLWPLSNFRPQEWVGGVMGWDGWDGVRGCAPQVCGGLWDGMDGMDG